MRQFRPAILLVVCACLPAQPSNSAPDKARCAVQGRVVSAATGAPLKKAEVRLEPFSPTRGVNGSPTVSGPTTTSDADGRFLLDNLDSGAYLLSVRRTGYLDQGYGARIPQVIGPPLKLSAGDRLTDLTLSMTPQSLLYGKVTDEDGDPVPEADVQVYAISYAGGRRRLAVVTGSETRDDGSFVIGNLAPGRYYLSGGTRESHSLAEQAALPREIYVTTWFPNTVDPAAAGPVEVAAAAEVRGIEIRMRKSRVFHIRGRTVDTATGTPAAQVWLHLLPRVEGPVVRPTVGVASGRDGRFEFNAVLPGSYLLEADASAKLAVVNLLEDVAPKMPNVLIGRTPVSVSDGDVEDLTLQVGDGVQINGAVTGVAYPAERPTLTLTAIDNHERKAFARVDEKGGFQIRRLVPGMYSLDLSLPEGAYVKSVKLGGRDITNDNLELTSGAAGPLEIAVSKDAAEVAGTVRDGKGEAARGAIVQIWPAGGDTARSVRSDESGGFRLTGLPPGEYRVAAWEELDDDLAEYPPFRARFEAEAVKVTVTERAHESVDVKLIGRESAEAEAARLK